MSPEIMKMLQDAATPDDKHGTVILLEVGLLLAA